MDPRRTYPIKPVGVKSLKQSNAVNCGSNVGIVHDLVLQCCLFVNEKVRHHRWRTLVAGEQLRELVARGRLLGEVLPDPAPKSSHKNFGKCA